MELIFDGNTKTVYAGADGLYLLRFKDVDTEGNPADNAGKTAVLLSAYFFQQLEAADIATHYIDADPHNGTMTVHPTRPVCGGSQLILRYNASAGFLERFGDYCQTGASLSELLEMRLSRLHGKPFVSQELLMALDMLSETEYTQLVNTTRRAAALMKSLLAEKGFDLYEVSLEFGETGEGQFVIINELSQNNMRIYREGEPAPQALLAAAFAAE